MKREIIFIVGLLSQPRIIKRIRAINEAGYQCTVYGYNRGKYDINQYPDNIKVKVLNELRDGGEYLKKFVIIWKDLTLICSNHKNKKTLFYAFGFIQALVLMIKGKKFIYEISDILYAYPKFDKFRALFKWLDKKIINKSVITLMTSGGFYNFYKIKNDNIIIQPNKVSPLLKNVERKVYENNSDSFSFGFVGAIRYESIFRFAQIIGDFFPQHKFLFFGGVDKDTAKKIDRLITKYKNIQYFGTFKNPEDLVEIYNKIDITVACYDVSSLNEQLAEPNKLYESILFCKPIVVSQGIFLSEKVKQLECGYSIDASKVETIIAFINSLTSSSIKKISINELLTSEEEIIDNPFELLNKLTRAIF